MTRISRISSNLARSCSFGAETSVEPLSEGSFTSHLGETKPCSLNPGSKVADTAQCFHRDVFFCLLIPKSVFLCEATDGFEVVVRGCNTLPSAGGFSALAPWCLAMANASRNFHMSSKTHQKGCCILLNVCFGNISEGISNWWCRSMTSQLIHLDKV